MAIQNAALPDVAIHNAFTFFPVRHTVAYAFCWWGTCSLPMPQSRLKAGYRSDSLVQPFVFPSFKSIYGTAATFARWLSYNQSSNPIIQSNWTQCSSILHSDNPPLRCPRKRYDKKRQKTKNKNGGAVRFQIIKINRFSCALFSPRQLLKPAPLTLSRSDWKPLDAFITDSGVFLGAFNIVSDRLPANEWAMTDLALGEVSPLGLVRSHEEGLF